MFLQGTHISFTYDPMRKKLLKTVELIIEKTDWNPDALFAPDQIISVREDLDEVDLQKRLKQGCILYTIRETMPEKGRRIVYTIRNVVKRGRLYRIYDTASLS